MTDRRRLSWRIALAIGAATVAVFSPALWNGFVDWDDPMNFTNNPHIRGLDWANLKWMVTAIHLGVYQPFAWFVAGVEYELGGLDPRVYHATSVLFHAATAVAVYALAVHLLSGRVRSVTALRLGAAIAALFFALHPLRVEAVAWASAQGYPLSALFYATALVAYLRAHRWPETDAGSVRSRGIRAGWFAVAVAAGLVACVSKPVAVTLPAVLLVLDWYPLRRLGGGRPLFRGSASRVWIEKLPFAVPAALVAVAAPIARASISGGEDYSLAALLARAIYGLAFYLWKTVVPLGLSHYHAFPPDSNPLETRFLVSGIAVATIGTALWIWRRKPEMVALFIAYGVMLSPVLGVLSHSITLAADRYAYFASIPVSLGLGAWFLTLWNRTESRSEGRALLIVGAAVALGVLSVLTWNQVKVWRDPGTLWAHAVAVAPRSARLAYQVHNNLGLFHLDQRAYELALREFDLVVRLNPDGYKGHFNRALTLARMDRTEEAIAAYQRGLGLRPNDPTALAHLGELLAKQGRFTEAEAAYLRAAALTPHPDLFNSLGIALAEQQRFHEAAEAFRRALALDPNHADAQANLNTALAIDAASGNEPR